MDSFYPQVLAGFIMVMTEEGDVIYLTENVSGHIGIAQVHVHWTDGCPATSGQQGKKNVSNILGENFVHMTRILSNMFTCSIIEAARNHFQLQFPFMCLSAVRLSASSCLFPPVICHFRHWKLFLRHSAAGTI